MKPKPDNTTCKISRKLPSDSERRAQATVFLRYALTWVARASHHAPDCERAGVAQVAADLQTAIDSLQRKVDFGQLARRMPPDTKLHPQLAQARPGKEDSD